MEAFSERLARLTELTADELSALEQEMVAAFDAADASGDVEAMQALADALDEVRAAAANAAPAEGEAPAEAPAVAAAADVIEETEGDTVSEENINETPQAATPDEVVKEVAKAEAVAEAADSATAAEAAEIINEAQEAVEAAEAAAEEAVAEATAEADTTTPADADAEAAPEELEEIVADEVTSEDVPAENQPELVTASAPYVITAGGDIPGFTAGQTLADMDEAIEALTARANTVLRASGEVRAVVASLQRDFDDDKMLRKSDPYGNAEKIRKIVAAGRDGGGEALTAAGWCAPKTPIYDHVNGMAIGVTDTPVLDSLPTLGVDRGGIVWNAPMSLGQIPTNFFGRWLESTAAPGEWGWVAGVIGDNTAVAGAQADKPCIDIPCPPEQETEIGAIPLCLCTDVLMSRANPEFIRHFTDLVLVAQARLKEQWALGFMATKAKDYGTGATALGTVDVPLGVARDILLVWRAAASNFRWVNRLSPTQSLRMYAPSWLRDAMVSDLTVQMPGDDTLSVSYAELESDIADINLDMVWYIDDMPGGLGYPANGDFDSPLGYAAYATWFMTVAGAVAHLDQGSLDLGVQRTKEDIQKNRFCEFSETFEGLAYMGPMDGTAGAWLIHGRTPVQIRGGFAPAVATVPAGGILIEN